jgi:hypothetical protein
MEIFVLLFYLLLVKGLFKGIRHSGDDWRRDR